MNEKGELTLTCKINISIGDYGKGAQVDGFDSLT